MILKRLSEISSQEKNSIEELINKCKYSSPFHKIDWLQIVQRVIDKEIFVIFRFFGNQKIDFYIPLIQEKKCVFYDILSYSLKYGLVHGGPLYKKGTVLLDKKFFREIKKILPKTTKTLSFTLPPNFPLKLCETKRLKHIYNTPIINLNDTLDNIWKSLEYKSIRWGINKAIKNGITLEIDNYNYINNFHDYLKKTYINFNKSILPLEYYKELVNLQFVHTFACIYKNIPIAISIIIVHKQTVYWWANSSSIEFRNLCPNDFLVWEVLKWAKGNGYMFFDFLITHIKNLPGRSRFKLKYSGKLYPIYEYKFDTIYVIIDKLIHNFSHPKYIAHKIIKRF